MGKQQEPRSEATKTPGSSNRLKRMLIDTTKKSSHVATKDTVPLLTREEGKSSLKNEEEKQISSAIHRNVQESVLKQQEPRSEATKTPGSRRQKRLLITK